MDETITTALDGFDDDLKTVAATAIGIGAAGLLVWIGWRLACKLPNRAVGK